MKLLIDMNLSPAWAGFLRSNGHEADHWSSLGSPSAPDSEIMSFARAHGYVVLTHDLDFSAILAANQGRKPSVIQLRADCLSPEALGRLVVTAITDAEVDLNSGALLTVDFNRMRIRILPLQKT